MNTQNIKYWIAGSRPRTFPNAIAPILCGTGAANLIGFTNWYKFIGLLLMSLCIIIGENYINDYADGIKGTDDNRVGPLRLVGSHIFAPQQVKLAAIYAFSSAAVIGLVLTIFSSWWLLLVGILTLIAAWNYTAGKNPYGYKGLGEIMVFIFFGLIAVSGSCFVIAGKISWITLLAAITMGCFSSAVLMINNIRDIATDKENNKITLPVKLGDTLSRKIYLIFLIIPLFIGIILSIYNWKFIGTLLCFPLILSNIKLVVNKENVKQKLIPGIGKTGMAMLIWAALFFLACFL